MMAESERSDGWRRLGRGFLDGKGGAWRSLSPQSGPPLSTGRPCLFLDRDGVLVEEVEYLGRREDMRLIPGAAQTLAAAQRAGFAVVVVTNQSGIARGYFDWRAFEDIHEEIDRQLALAGARIDSVYACGYHASGSAALRIPAHPWRKPSPGMILAGLSDVGADPARSYLVGDRLSDIEAGKAAGLAGAVLVRTGYGSDPSAAIAARACATPGFMVDVADDLADAWHRLRASAADDIGEAGSAVR